MKRKSLASLLSMSLLSAFYLSPAFAEIAKDVAHEMTEEKAEKKATTEKHTEKSLHWGYSGSEGPEFWGDLSANYSTCKTGSNQSPVDIKGSLLDANLPVIPFKYNMLTPSMIINNGHTVQVNMWSGGEITVDDIKFKLKQFHFHTPSENKINGQSFPLEAHFVHLSEDNEIAVVAILFSPGAADATLTNLWENLPMDKGDESKLDSHSLKPLEMEAKLSNYYRFNGSLTTPPCTEGVIWMVMKQPMMVSKEQVEAFTHVMHHPNNRPVQPVNARPVLQ